MVDFNKLIKVWQNALMKPSKTFKEQARHANLKDGAIMFAISGVIVALLTIITSAADVTTIISGPISTIIGWLIFSGILLLFAKLFGGKGNFNTQSYLLAVYGAPLAIVTGLISAVASLTGISGISMLSGLLGIYGLYLLTLALKETHEYSMMRAFLTWAILIIVFIVILVMVAATMLTTILGIFGLGALSLA
ncbi:MAG: DUF2207 domain-containing protein [Candidatus Aenigmarchaeota archaeon]|nr:DUF2207 domain-containing protein [Candidatus Aenigmarchaeota archaeon]